MALFLWKLSQNINNDYDTFSSAIVVSATPADAKHIHPMVNNKTGEIYLKWNKGVGCWQCPDGQDTGDSAWVEPDDVVVTCVGMASDWLGEGAVVCSSFHAG
jgi:hypothetical protein